MTDIKEKKPRTPQKNITAGALKLPLADRVQLVKELQTSITTEVTELQKTAAEATKIANGTS